MPNPNFDQITATTIAEHARSLANNIFDTQPYLFWLQSGDRVRNYSGGDTIKEPIIYGKNSTTETYSGYDLLDVTPQDGISAASFDVKQAHSSIIIDGFSEVVNSGPQQMIDLLEGKIMQSRESITDFMNEMLLNSDGTGNSGKDWLGLKALVGGEYRSPSVGGIDASQAANAYWRSVVNDGGLGEAIANSATEPDPRALQISEMRTMYNDVSNGADQPDLILTSQAQFEAYEALLGPNQARFDTSMADAGFTNLLYKGTPVVYDDYVEDGDMYFLNSKYLKLRPFPARWFTTTPYLIPTNQDAKIAHIFMFGQQTINNRRRHGILSNLEVV